MGFIESCITNVLPDQATKAYFFGSAGNSDPDITFTTVNSP